MRRPALSRLLPASLVLLALSWSPLSAQQDEAWRVGLTLGGSSFVGVVVEYRRDATAVELGLGTWSLRDAAVTLSGKYYAGRASVSPYAGLGLWLVVAPPGDTTEEERTGAALILRAPLGVDGGVADHHAIGLELALNRAIAVRRTDLEDVTPPSRRLVPLPGIYYKVGRIP